MIGIQYSHYILPIGFALLLIASILRLLKRKNTPNVVMLVGSALSIMAIAIIYISPYFQESSHDPETNLYTVQMNWWDSLIPYLVPSGMLLFSIGFLMDTK